MARYGSTDYSLFANAVEPQGCISECVAAKGIIGLHEVRTKFLM